MDLMNNPAHIIFKGSHRPIDAKVHLFFVLACSKVFASWEMLLSKLSSVCALKDQNMTHKWLERWLEWPREVESGSIWSCTWISSFDPRLQSKCSSESMLPKFSSLCAWRLKLRLRDSWEPLKMASTGWECFKHVAFAHALRSSPWSRL